MVTKKAYQKKSTEKGLPKKGLPKKAQQKGACKNSYDFIYLKLFLTKTSTYVFWSMRFRDIHF